MRILHLAWEYPPVMYGGLGRHVHALANAQSRLGHQVVVVTQAEGANGTAADESGVRVLRAGVDRGGHDPGDLLAHVAQMEWGFTDHGEELLASWTPDVIHAHDWMVAHAAVALRRSADVPLVATLHATEAGRHSGWVTTDLSTAIHAMEWWLANTANGVIACSEHMRAEVRSLFGVDAVSVIPNGIERSEWKRPHEQVIRRIRDVHGGPGPLVAYTGRVEWEKGVQTLLEAMPRLRAVHGGLRLIVAGRGSHLPDLQRLADHLGLGDSVRFLGWVSEEDLRAIVAASDVTVAPSLYEPFGLVALEAAALGTPVVVARTGGLAEFADRGHLAATFRPGDPDSLASAILADLADPRAARSRAQRASRALVERYDWKAVAGATVRAYEQADGRRGWVPGGLDGAGARTRHDLHPPHLVAPLGRLLDLGT